MQHALFESTKAIDAKIVRRACGPAAVRVVVVLFAVVAILIVLLMQVSTGKTIVALAALVLISTAGCSESGFIPSAPNDNAYGRGMPEGGPVQDKSPLSVRTGTRKKRPASVLGQRNLFAVEDGSAKRTW